MTTSGNTTNLKVHMEKMHPRLLRNNKNKKYCKDLLKQPYVEASFSSSLELAKAATSLALETDDCYTTLIAVWLRDPMLGNHFSQH